MRRVYLSPHLDDAVLSCGGAIHRHAIDGEPVLVVSFLAAEPPQRADLSSFALLQHEYWGNPPRPMALRRSEDLAALSLLGAEGLHLEYRDAVYRAGVDGQWLYTDLATLLGDVHPLDPLGASGARELLAWLADLFPQADQQVLYAPLGAGRHVDHQIVHTAAWELHRRGYQIAFYEDYPYAERPGAVEAARALKETAGWRSSCISLDAANVAAKVSALGYYRSQMGILFGGAVAMPNRVWSFAATRSTGDCLAERLWWLD
ncbi:PIG-L deacetylase family protein [Chloroflexota bacterium]